MVGRSEHETSEDYPSHLPLEQRLAYILRNVTGPEQGVEQPLPEEQSPENSDYVEPRTVIKTPSGLSHTSNVIPLSKKARMTILELALLASFGLVMYVHNDKMAEGYDQVVRPFLAKLQEGPRILEDDQFGYHTKTPELYS